MKVLQLSTFDGRFGASIAARRLHEALLASGEECDFLVSEVLSDSLRTHGPISGWAKFQAKLRNQIDGLPLHLYPRRRGGFSPNWVPYPLSQQTEPYHSDVIHLHWCQSNFVPTPVLPHLNRPLIWTFHDMWAFTGGCHYNAGCERYQIGCGNCPVLGSTNANDLSHWLWSQKREVYQRIRKSLQIICPSHWLADVARKAPLLEGIPVHTVPNPIHTKVFKPMEQGAARRLLGLPEKGPLLLWGATAKGDHRKGFDLLEDALMHYSAQPDTAALGIVTLGLRGNSGPAKTPKLQNWRIGFLQDEISLAALYSAVDVVALPSRQENLSNMLSEALCCGTPCLAFRLGGNTDLIQHQENGYLAKPDDIRDMAEGLHWILQKIGEKQRPLIAASAQAKVSSEILVPQFLKIYQDALARW